MQKRQKTLPILLVLSSLMFLVHPVFSAYGTIDRVVVSAPSSTSLGQAVKVQATIYTTISGWGTCTVREVQTVLIVPSGVTVTSGSNSNVIGTMAAGTSATVMWTIICQNKGAYNLEVSAAGIDSNGYPCSASDSITVTVDEGGSILPSPELHLPVIIIGAVVAAILITALVLLKRRRARVRARLDNIKLRASHIQL